ncbi:hypothetical protein [Pseudomonas huaxiensis]|uniref:hypothetical protein n=1 Tax=Pseudomonas huaxiensis TaxID=2213017 RepID=UPI000DA6819D|nr:hypothetical protein [Pseudomonas huaxiensis]
MKNLLALAKRLGSLRFWISTLLLGGLAFWCGRKLVDLKLTEKYQALDPSIQELLSVPEWWLETLAGACIPMFVIFAFQFYTLKLFTDSDLKEKLIAMLPFLPKLGWLAGKPIMFMLMTGTFLMGMASRLNGLALTLSGGAGLLIVMLGFVVKYNYNLLLSGRNFGKCTSSLAIWLGHLCLLIAIGCWLYADAWAPFKQVLWLAKKLAV